MNVLNPKRGRIFTGGQRETDGSRLDAYISRVRSVRSHVSTCTVSAAFDAIVRGWEVAQVDLSASALESLKSAIVNGDVDHVPGLLLEAGVACSPELNAVRNAAAKAALPLLQRAYSDTAAANYAAVGKWWTEEASELRACAKAVPLGAPADDVITEKSTVQRAWTSAVDHAKELERRLPVLVEAATLASLPVYEDVDVLGLIVDPESDPAVVRAALQVQHRCGLWGALLDAGVVVRATPLEMFRRFEWS